MVSSPKGTIALFSEFPCFEMNWLKLNFELVYNTYNRVNTHLPGGPAHPLPPPPTPTMNPQCQCWSLLVHAHSPCEWTKYVGGVQCDLKMGFNVSCGCVHRDMRWGGGGGGAKGMHSSPRIFQTAFFKQRKASNIQAKSLDFGVSTGKNIRARDLNSPPPPPPAPNETGPVPLRVIPEVFRRNRGSWKSYLRVCTSCTPWKWHSPSKAYCKCKISHDLMTMLQDHLLGPLLIFNCHFG